MFKFFNKNTIGEIILKDGEYTLYKTCIDNLKRFNCINWNKNRPYDKVRVNDIKKHYINEKLKVIPGIIYAWKNENNILEIFDGIHRYLAGSEIGNMELLIQIYETAELNIIKEFKIINKSVSVPTIYLEENNYIKRKVCENVVRHMCEKYKNCVSPSRNCQQQNFNRDNLIEFISKLEIDFEIKNVDNIIIQELYGLNYQAKDYVTKNKIPVPQKSHYNNFYLFYLHDGFIKDKLETSIMRNY